MRYKKARWWGLWPCGHNDKEGVFQVYGVKIDYGSWWGKTVLLHDAKMLLGNTRIRRKDRDWLKGVL